MSEEKRNPAADLNGILFPGRQMPEPSDEQGTEISELMQQMQNNGLFPLPYSLDRVAKWLTAQNLQFKRETDESGTDHLTLPVNNTAFFHFVQQPEEARMVVGVHSVDLDYDPAKVLEVCNLWNQVSYFPKTIMQQLPNGKVEARGEYCFLFPEGLHDQLLHMHLQLVFSTGLDMTAKVVAYLEGKITDLTAPLPEQSNEEN